MNTSDQPSLMTGPGMSSLSRPPGLLSYLSVIVSPSLQMSQLDVPLVFTNVSIFVYMLLTPHEYNISKYYRRRIYI